MLDSHKDKTKVLIIILSILTYVLIFFFKEHSPSGSQVDFNSFVFNNIQIFKNDFYYAIKNYGLLGDGNYPLFYIFHAYLNPFSSSPSAYLISTSIIGFITFIIFAFSLKNLKFNNIDSLLFSSLILILPWFNGRAHWGTSANLGLLFLIISFYFFTKIKNNQDNFNFKNIFLLTFFSSAALYTRNSFIFFPIFLIFYFFINTFNFKYKSWLILNYTFFSIPGFILIFLWGGIFDTKNLDIFSLHSPKNIIKNIPILLNYLFFYLWPIFFVELNKIGSNKFFQKYFYSFITILMVFALLTLFGKMEYLSNYVLGGGVTLEFGYMVGDKFNIIFLITSAIGLSFLFSFLKFDFKNNFILFFLIFIIFGFPQALYQDYLEPLLIFLFFLGIINSNAIFYLKNNTLKLSTIYFLYFSFYNFFTTIYRTLDIG